MKTLFIFLFLFLPTTCTLAQNMMIETMPSFIVNPENFSEKYKIYTNKGGFLYFTDVVPTSNKEDGRIEEDFFRKLLGGVHYVFVPQTKSNYFLALYISPHKPITHKEIAEMTARDLDLRRVKSDLDYGAPYSSTYIDLWDVVEYLKTYSSAEAQQLFGTSFVASYPLNLRGKIWGAQYSRARCFVTLNETNHFYFYIFFTDDYTPCFMDNFKRDVKGDFNFSTYSP